MDADKSAKNTPSAPKFICPIRLPKPKSMGFWWKKASLGVRSLCSKQINKEVTKIEKNNLQLDLTFVVVVTFWQKNNRITVTESSFNEIDLFTEKKTKTLLVSKAHKMPIASILK